MSVLRSDRLPPLLLAAFATLGAFPVVRSLLVADLNWCYPYLSSDSYDWIANGLYLAGEKVASSWRPPGLPLLIAALFKLGLLSWLPVANVAVLGLTTAALYLLLRERHGAWISACAAWFFFANDYVQDLTKWVMAEIYCTLFIVLAARAFFRAARDPRGYRTCTLLLGVGFLFHNATLIVGIGFAIALLVTRRADVRRREVWQGLGGAALIVGGWVVARWLHYRANPGGPRHGVEDLLRFAPENIRFYAIAGTALLGLAILPLYGAGFLRFVAKDFPDRAYRAAVAAPLVSLGAFWLFFYDWVDKRFLYYLFPFCLCLLAEGLESLAAYARRGRLATALAGAFLLVAILWNQIRYPSYGFQYLALTPRDFLETSITQDVALKSTLHLAGARIVRLHDSLPSALSRGLFDFRLNASACTLSTESYACLVDLKRESDRLLIPGEPIGLEPLPGWPADYYASLNRLGNTFRRPVSLPKDARVALVSRGSARTPPLASCGPYALVAGR
jgi:hypothetical protein